MIGPTCRGADHGRHHKSAEYATFLQETEGYKRKILGIKRSDTMPEGVKSYDGMTFLCYEATASMDRDGLTCITRNNVVCGGAVYCGIGSRRLSKPDFDQGLEMVVGENRAYSTKTTMRRVNQQIAHFDEKHKYLIMGKLEEMPDPEVVMIITDPQRVMRLCKAYTWKTGELVHALGGTNWCGMSFPEVFGQDDDLQLRRSAVADLHAAGRFRDVLRHPLGSPAAHRRQPEERLDRGGVLMTPPTSWTTASSAARAGTSARCTPSSSSRTTTGSPTTATTAGKCIKACPNFAIAKTVTIGMRLD